MKLKRFISALLTLLVMLSIMPFSVAADDTLTDGDFEYEMYDDSSVIITGYKRDMSEKLTIPSTLGGYPVKAIGEDAFSDKEIYQVILPDSLEVIEDFAFWNTALYSVKIPRYVSYIGIGAFSGGLFTKYEVADYNNTYRAFRGSLYNSSLSELISFPTMAEFYICPDTRTITPYAFISALNLKDVKIHAKVDYIGEGAFMYSSIESVNITNADYIDHYAFYGCENLTSVEVSHSTTSISPDAFEETAWLKNQSDGLIFFNDNSMVYTYKGTAPEKIELKLGTYAINGKAFAEQKNIKEIIIPTTVGHIDFSAFDECSSLESITVDEQNSSYKSIDGLLYSNDETKLYVCPAGKTGTVTVSKNTIHLEDYTFEYCEKVTDIILPYGIKSIGEGAFFGCTSIKSIKIPSYVEIAGDGIFVGCSSLEDITIPEGTILYSYIDFLGTRWLELHPQGVLYLCNNAIGYKGEPFELKELTLKDGTVAIAENAFFGYETLSKVNLPTSLKKIGDMAFASCPSLKEITIPASVEYLGLESFGHIRTYDSETGYWSSSKVDKFTVIGYDHTSAMNFANFYDFDFISLGEMPFVQMLGDADRNGVINVRDATAIQKHIAFLIILDYYQLKNADFNGDGNINVKDATAIQKHLAGIAY